MDKNFFTTKNSRVRFESDVNNETESERLKNHKIPLVQGSQIASYTKPISRESFKRVNRQAVDKKLNDTKSLSHDGDKAEQIEGETTYKHLKTDPDYIDSKN